jgi:hypothetical protein
VDLAAGGAGQAAAESEPESGWLDRDANAAASMASGPGSLLVRRACGPG